MNAVLNYRQNRGGLNAPSPQDQIQGYPEICQERSNTRRRSRPSTSSKMKFFKIILTSIIFLKSQIISLVYN